MYKVIFIHTTSNPQQFHLKANLGHYVDQILSVSTGSFYTFSIRSLYTAYIQRSPLFIVILLFVA